MSLSKFCPTEINGVVELKFSHTSKTQEVVNVSGKYPRIKPNCARDPIELKSEIVGSLSAKLVAAVAAEGAGFKSEHLVSLASSAVQFGVYCYPTASLESKQLFFVLRHFLWYSLYSDALKKAWTASTLTIATLRSIHASFVKILGQDSSEFQEFEESQLPEFRGLSAFLRGNVELGFELAGSSYLEGIEAYIAALQYSFESNEWFTASHLDGRSTLKTYHLWRMGACGGEPALEAVAFADRVRIPASTRVTPAFRRSVAIVMSNVAWTRDLFGLGGPIENPEYENEITFRVSKGESFGDAVSGTCISLDEELHDLVMIKKALVDVMGCDENLLRYLDAVDNLVDGQNLGGVQTLPVGALSLNRDEEGTGGACFI